MKTKKVLPEELDVYRRTTLRTRNSEPSQKTPAPQPVLVGRFWSFINLLKTVLLRAFRQNRRTFLVAVLGIEDFAISALYFSGERCWGFELRVLFAWLFIIIRAATSIKSLWLFFASSAAHNIIIIIIIYRGALSYYSFRFMIADINPRDHKSADRYTDTIFAIAHTALAATVCAHS